MNKIKITREQLCQLEEAEDMHDYDRINQLLKEWGLDFDFYCNSYTACTFERGVHGDYIGCSEDNRLTDIIENSNIVEIVEEE